MPSARIVRHVIRPENVYRLFERSRDKIWISMGETRNSIVILGGGISGLVLADRLLTQGVDCTILEAQDHLGGLAASRKVGVHKADVGPHLFIASDPKISNFVTHLFEGRPEALHPLKRSARMLFQDRYIDYPLTVKSIFIQMGLGAGIKAAVSYFFQRFQSATSTSVAEINETAESWSIRTFGDYLYRLFFKPYTEQFWKRSAREMSSAAIPISKKVTFLSTLFSTFGRSRYVDRETLPVHYPSAGFGEIAERIGERVLKDGGRIEIGAKMERIERVDSGYRVFYRQNGELRHISAPQVVSTIPIHKLVHAISPAVPDDVLQSANRMEYLGLIVVCLVTSRWNVLNGHQYLYTMGRPYHRISEMSAYHPEICPPGKNVLLLEVTDTEEGERWKRTDQELYESCLESIIRDKHLGAEDIQEYFVMRSAEAYPFFKNGFQVDVDRIKKHIETIPGLHLLGRTGTFTYLDSDLCMSRAFELAEEIGLADDRT